jgi:hypothetical protein
MEAIMRTKYLKHWLSAAAGVAGAATALALSAPPAHAAKTYYIDEGTDFTGNGCDIADVNTITESLQTSLSAAGWTGNRNVNISAWPQDFWEACSTTYGSGGLDSSYGDTGTLAVYAGHGSPHTIYFGYAHNGACSTDLTANSRLGEMSGGSAGFGMWLACDVIQSSELTTSMTQRLRQQASWQNTIGIGDDEPRDFFDATIAKTNADAWLDQMSSGGRDAIIASFSNTSSGCWTAMNSAKLKGNVYNSPFGGGASCGGSQPAYWSCYEDRQN